MKYGVRKGSALAKELGLDGARFLNHALSSLDRLLPHTLTKGWTVSVVGAGKPTEVVFAATDRKALRLSLVLLSKGKSWCLTGTLERLKAPKGVGAIGRTISTPEKLLADRVLRAASLAFAEAGTLAAPVLGYLIADFDERVVADSIRQQYELEVDVGAWFTWLRKLSEQTYENKSLTIGCVIDVADKVAPANGVNFPSDFLERKKFRALSDGFRTAYLISSKGAMKGLVDLTGEPTDRKSFYPVWCENLAANSRTGNLAFCLTRQGDILVFCGGSLTYSYRFGKWQYWNHSHIVDLLANAARHKKVEAQVVAKVVRVLYRVSLDVAFRRSGGLFVILKSKAGIRSIVRRGDGVEDAGRGTLERAFEDAMTPFTVHAHQRSVITELATVDGAVVVTRDGHIRAWGAVLEPRRKKRTQKEEGSRTKAAIGASNFGLAMKVSSDGDITAYKDSAVVIRV